MKKRILGVALAAVFAAGTANALIIDDFDGAATLIVAADGSEGATYTGAIGEYRMVEITKSGPLSASAGVLVGTGYGLYSHSAEALTSATSMITWDANGAGLMGVDFTEGLIDNIFSFDIMSIDQGHVDLNLTVWDTYGTSQEVSLVGAGTGMQSIAFADFTNIDFSVVDGVSLQVVGGQASDLTLDMFETSGDVANPVPEPATFALLGFGLAAIGVGRRKAKKA